MVQEDGEVETREAASVCQGSSSGGSRCGVRDAVGAVEAQEAVGLKETA